MDLAPTILEMAGLAHPAPRYQSRDIVPMRGTSMLPFLHGSTPRIHPADFIQGWETAGRGALRPGDWKIVFIPRPKGSERWQLYNIATDPGEVHDLSEMPEQAERMKRMSKLWEQYVFECGVIPLAPELGKFLEAMEAQGTEDVWIEYPFNLEGAREDPEKFRRKVPRFTVSQM